MAAPADTRARRRSLDGPAHTAPPDAVRATPKPGPYRRFVKPVLDRVAGMVLSVLLAPLLGVLALLVRIRLGPPAIFRQRRVGLEGREFTVYKLRTMDIDRRREQRPILHEDRRRTHKTTADPRHTRLGRTLRKWSLDELPQVWNLARGEMSLVGPRPELPSIVSEYEPWQHRRHEVRPGITGLWQISARGEIPMHEATDVDIAYVDAVTFLGDLRIILRSPAAVLGRRKGE